tara:strand:- start:122 stop:553 length:432 start_codon:yes stop_codon:yes gene_type:complete
MAAARAAEPGAQLDVAFIAYFEAYQEYLTLMQELQSVNGEGHISLARARNNLSRSRNTLSPCIGTLQFPRKMRANWRIESKEEEEVCLLRMPPRRLRPHRQCFKSASLALIQPQTIQSQPRLKPHLRRPWGSPPSWMVVTLRY